MLDEMLRASTFRRGQPFTVCKLSLRFRPWIESLKLVEDAGITCSDLSLKASR
jgi:hypothetical protein